MQPRNTLVRRSNRRHRAVRAAAVLGVAALLAALALLLAAAATTSWRSLTGPGPADLDNAVVLLAASAGAVVAGWLAVGALVALATLLCGGARSSFVPAMVYVVVAAILGVGVAPAAAWADTSGGLGAPTPAPVSTSQPLSASPVDPGWGAALAASATPTATAAPPPSPAGTSAPTLTSMPDSAAEEPVDPGPVDPGWLPAAPAPAPRTAAPADSVLLGSPRAGLAPEEEVVVRRGDTLWDLAARHLGPGAGDAEIAVEWPRWHEVNRDTIGADPDLLLPGQQLRPPP